MVLQYSNDTVQAIRVLGNKINDMRINQEVHRQISARLNSLGILLTRLDVLIHNTELSDEENSSYEKKKLRVLTIMDKINQYMEEDFDEKEFDVYKITGEKMTARLAEKASALCRYVQKVTLAE